jgi:PAS domain S-box-containing protein
MQGARIMVVEDEVVVAMELEKRLGSLGYTVTGIIGTGEEAVERAGQVDPDFVLMDIKLAGRMDGIEAAEKIRERYDIPVVFLTAHTDEKTLQRAKLSEPFGYLVKPFSETELRTTIEVAIHKHQQDKKNKQTSHWFLTVLNVLSGAVIVTDEDGTVKQMNPLAESLTGWQAYEAVGRDLSEIYILTNLKTALANVSSFSRDSVAASPVSDHVLISRQGTQIPVTHSVVPLVDSKGRSSVVAVCFQEAPEGQTHPPDWFSHAANLYLAARMCHAEGQYLEAETFYKRALSIVEKTLGSDHPKLAAWLDDLAAVFRSLGKIDEAKMLDLRAARIRASHSAQQGQKSG